ncbi:MAG: beta-lactamase family protein [Prolixibacteraceae bacterium]|nr:beta-lactamase family protein [Prolixibacteraceae bacterium]MBN2774440.1 beta-lactamase family protein [Prolixibacteraceae bacterium]
MKNLLICFIFVCILTADSQPLGVVNKNNSDQAEQQLKELLEKTIKVSGIPGITAAISDAKGLLLIESAGVRKTGTFMQITNNDFFHIGSCTKAMTSSLLAMLIDKGKLNWESTITEILPEVKTEIHEKYHQVTLHQLVTHRGGIPSNATDWSAFESMELIDRRLAILKENLKNSNNLPVGEYLYSNLGYMIAGCMAERVTGKTWEAIIKEYLFDPLEMTTAGFGPPGTEILIDQPWGHVKINNLWIPRFIDNPESLGPAGRVHCSIEDWAKFISLFLMSNKNKLLNTEQLNILIDPVGDYASGWGVVSREWARGIALSHSGSNTMWYTTVWVAPAINRAFFVAANSAGENAAAINDKIIGELIRLNSEFFH